MASAPSKLPIGWLLTAIAVALLLVVASKLRHSLGDKENVTAGRAAHNRQPALPADVRHGNSTPDRPRQGSRNRGDARTSRPEPKTHSGAKPARTATPEPGDPYLGLSLQEMEPGYNLEEVCTIAGREFNVPPDLLKAVAYIESEGTHGSGSPNSRGGRGLMGLRDTPERNTLQEAAVLLELPPADLVRDPVQNARGAAALLRQYHTEAELARESAAPDEVPGAQSLVNQAWITALSYYSALPPEQSVTYTQDIANLLYEGAAIPSPDGTTATITARQTWGE